MRLTFAFVALFVCSVAYADPCTCQQKASTGNPCLCIFGCECVKAADPVKPPPPVDSPVINLCGCQVGEPCTCGASCHCHSATWSEVDGTTARQIALFKNGKQIGSYRFDTGVFLPLSGDVWGKACRSPVPLPGRGRTAPAQSAPVPQFRSQPQSFFPQLRTGGRSGGC